MKMILIIVILSTLIGCKMNTSKVKTDISIREIPPDAGEYGGEHLNGLFWATKKYSDNKTIFVLNRSFCPDDFSMKPSRDLCQSRRQTVDMNTFIGKMKKLNPIWKAEGVHLGLKREATEYEGVLDSYQEEITNKQERLAELKQLDLNDFVATERALIEIMIDRLPEEIEADKIKLKGAPEILSQIYRDIQTVNMLESSHRKNGRELWMKFVSSLEKVLKDGLEETVTADEHFKKTGGQEIVDGYSWENRYSWEVGQPLEKMTGPTELMTIAFNQSLSGIKLTTVEQDSWTNVNFNRAGGMFSNAQLSRDFTFKGREKSWKPRTNFWRKITLSQSSFTFVEGDSNTYDIKLSPSDDLRKLIGKKACQISMKKPNQIPYGSTATLRQSVVNRLGKIPYTATLEFPDDLETRTPRFFRISCGFIKKIKGLGYEVSPTKLKNISLSRLIKEFPIDRIIKFDFTWQ